MQKIKDDAFVFDIMSSFILSDISNCRITQSIDEYNNLEMTIIMLIRAKIGISKGLSSAFRTARLVL